MSTLPINTEPVRMQNLVGAQIQSAFADTSDGVPLVGVGIYPRLAVSGACVLGGGSITTLRVKLVGKWPGNTAFVSIASTQAGSTTPAVEHSLTSTGDYCLLTTNHCGALEVYALVEGNVDGSSTDAITAYGQGVTP